MSGVAGGLLVQTALRPRKLSLRHIGSIFFLRNQTQRSGCITEERASENFTLPSEIIVEQPNMSAFIDWSKSTKSSAYRGSGSFSTFLIIGPTCFFLGILFASFPYDFPLLWSKEVVDPSFYDQLETHLKFMHQAPPLIGRMLNIMISVGFLGLFIKLFRPSEANFLFDGASLILYVIGVAVYISNIVKGLRTVSSGMLNTPEFETTKATSQEGEFILGREDSLRVLAASNTILALVLIGVLVLQAGQWYAEKRDMDDDAAELKKKKEGSPSKASTKKKQ